MSKTVVTEDGDRIVYINTSAEDALRAHGFNPDSVNYSIEE